MNSLESIVYRSILDALMSWDRLAWFARAANEPALHNKIKNVVAAVEAALAEEFKNQKKSE